jgi:hypothetical protein
MRYKEEDVASLLNLDDKKLNKPIYMMRGTEGSKSGLRDLINATDLPERESFTMIELGSYAGESASVFLEFPNLSKLYCVDRWTENPDATIPSARPDVAEALFDLRYDRWIKQGRDVVKIKDTTKAAASQFSPHSVDIVYIDAAHTYEGVCSDIDTYYPIASSWIAGHDWQIEGVRNAVREKLIERLDLGPPQFFGDNSWLFKVPS